MRARPKRRGKLKDDGERSIIADDNLDRDFEADRTNQKWLADFTYIWTAAGWLYVAVVLDLFSRRVVGWPMKADRDASLVMDALMMAVWRRGKSDALLHHSDQGSQSPVSSSNACSSTTASSAQWAGPATSGTNGGLLLSAEDRADCPQGLPHARRSPCRYLRLHRAILQSATTSLEAGYISPMAFEDRATQT